MKEEIAGPDITGVDINGGMCRGGQRWSESMQSRQTSRIRRLFSFSVGL